MDIFFLALWGGLGLIWGSFLNVVIYRLPKIDIAGLRRRTPHTLTYLALPLSFCPQCKARILPWHNIPLLSYLLLGAKGKCCGARISWVYPAVEIGGAAIFIAALLTFRGWIDTALAIAFLSVLLVTAAIDWQRYYLLDILSYPLLWLGLLANIDARFTLLPHAVLGAAAAYAGIALFTALFSRIIGRRAMGAGDYKLFAALGAWFGWQPLPILLFVAALTAIFFAMLRRLIRGRGRHIPFGPGLAVAGASFILFGDDIMLAYWRFLSA